MPKYLIQIVDDEVNVARTLQMVLELEGYNVTCCNSAREALKRYREGLRPDAAIIDLNMEKEDIGLLVAKAAQKLRPAPVIIICTGYANTENIQTALDIRVHYLATKPVDLDELKGALTRLLQRRAGERKPKTKAKAKTKRAGARG